MRKIFAFILIVSIILTLCSCKKDKAQIYKDFLENNFSFSDDILYAFKDIDCDENEELLIKQNTCLSIYSLKKDVTKLGEYEFATGTLRLLYSKNKNYCGIICFTIGGGMYHYSYLTIKNNKVVNTKILDYDYSGIVSPDEKFTYTSDQQLITEVQNSYYNNNDIFFTTLSKSDNKLFDYLQNKTEYTFERYVYIDLDKDGKKELVAFIPSKDQYLIIREDKNKIQTYLINNRSFISLKTDGSFIASGGAGVNEYCEISFNSKDYTIITVAKKYDHSADDSINVYELYGNPSTKEQVDLFVNDWHTKPLVNWTYFNN